jgi:hypothetical protein
MIEIRVLKSASVWRIWSQTACRLSMMSAWSCSGRVRISSSRQQLSGTILVAVPPVMRLGLIDGCEMTVEEVAAELGQCPQQVCRWEEQAYRIMHHPELACSEGDRSGILLSDF